MKEKIKQFIYKIVSSAIEDKVKRIAYESAKELTHNQFAYISISKLYKLLEEVSKRDEKYVSLAELYSMVMRDNLARENSEIIHNYFELQPKLNQYTQSLEKVVDINK
jgi:hypothetical protein